MRYAILSDIHANLQAWNAVLLDIRSIGADKIISLGDVVGYGPNPAEVLKSVYENTDYLVLGNHDAVICGKMDEDLFNDRARHIIQWTRFQLNANALKFLRSIPLSLANEIFRCAHGDFSDPALFNYVIEPADAAASWQTAKEQLLFIGHTHKPAIFLLGPSGIPRAVEPQDFVLEDGKRFLVNVGSVGQPRDGDTRACYCMFDTDNNSVFWRRIPFDLDIYREAFGKAGMTVEPSAFLCNDPRKAVPPLRELLNFSPPKTQDKAARDTIAVQKIEDLQRRVTRWRLLAIVIACSFLSVAGILGASWWRYLSRALTIGDSAATPIMASVFPCNTNLLSMPSRQTPAGASIPAWTVRLGDKRKQSVRVDFTDGNSAPAFVMRSQARRDEIDLSSSPIMVAPAMSFCAEAMVRTDNTCTGDIAMVVSLTTRQSSSERIIDEFVHKEPTLLRQGGWRLAKKTFTIPANSVSMQLHLRGRFVGQVAVRSVGIERRK